MQTYYVKLDKDGFVTDQPSLDKADGLTEVQCPASSVGYFTRYFTKYRVVNNQLVAPGNLPDISIDYLTNLINKQQDEINQQQDQIKAQTDNVNKLSNANNELQKMVGGLTAQLSVALNK